MYSSYSSKEERDRQKELIKSLETPEEKRLRRLAKKEYKERKMKTALGWGQEYLGFTNQQNPYGDSNLLQKFVWKKKDEMKRENHDENVKTAEETAKEARLELEKLKRRRIEREREKAEREHEREFLQREKEAEYYKEWEHHEDAFHLEQVRLRSKIRIQDGRAKAIDLLARYIDETESENRLKLSDDTEGTAVMHPVETCFEGLTRDDLEDLLADIEVYRKLDSTQHGQYWSDVTVLTMNFLAIDAADGSPGVDGHRDTSGINSVVADEVSSIFRSKSYAELEALERNVQAKIRAAGQNIDLPYWESLINKLQVCMTKERFRLRHQQFLRRKLDQMRAQMRTVCGTLFPSAQEDNRKSQDYSGRYSPVLIDAETLDIGQYVMDEMELAEKLVLKRAQVIGTGSVIPDVEDAFEQKARLGITGRPEEEEEGSSVLVSHHGREGFATAAAATAEDSNELSVEEIPIEFRYLWSDKYRPRKPRFFNKVHTGYDWNQYNKKHYDTDNPPPKTVQGYKFNIFYPDLIDRAKAPQYDLKICEETRDFATLRFHAGPPYEDIAFKIVNKEWDFSYKHGFRCQFQNGIFQLWFHFRKWKYRR